MKVLNLALIGVLILFIGLSGYTLASSSLSRSANVLVTSVENDADCGQLKAGDRVSSVGQKTIRNAADFYAAVSNVKSGDYISMIVNDGPGGCKAVRDGGLGFTVEDAVSSNLRFGSDVSESTSYVYSVQDANSTALAKIKNIIDGRKNFYDFQQTRVEVAGDKIKIVTVFDDELPNLIRNGRLRGTVFESFKLEQGVSKVIVGNSTYVLHPKNETLSVNGTDYPIDKSFELSGVTFHFINVTGSTINLEADLYDNEDVIVSSTSQIMVRMDSKSGVYYYYIAVSVAPDVNEKLTNIIRKAESTFVPGGGTVLNARLNYYVDDQTVSSLTIPVDLIDSEINAISGIEKSADEAYKIGQLVYTSLRFGPLPANLKLESQNVEEPTISKTVSYGTLIIGFVSMICILGYTFIKTKRPKIVFWIFVLVLAELFISVGLLAATTKYLGVRLLVDFPVLLGVSLLMVYLPLTFFVYFEGLEGRHKHITIGYKKIISLMNFLRLFLIAVIVVGIVGYRGMSFVLLVGFIVDSMLMKQMFKILTTKKTL